MVYVRRFGKLGAVTLGATLGGGYVLFRGSQPTLALEGTDQFVANNASVEAHDGSVEAVRFGDPGGDDDGNLQADSDRLNLSWDGIDEPAHDDPDFTIEVRGADNPTDTSAEAFSSTSDAASYEQILSQIDAVSITETNGSAAYSWNDVFGTHTADVLSHTGLTAGDFAAGSDGGERTRELQVRIGVTWEADSSGTTVTAEKEARATITVSNRGASVTVGGEGSFEVTSSEETA